MQDVELQLRIKNCGCFKQDQEKELPKSAVKIAVDMVKEKLISKKEAVLRIDPNSLDYFASSYFR
jgi:pyruvate,orthophosphate dikinase